MRTPKWDWRSALSERDAEEIMALDNAINAARQDISGWRERHKAISNAVINRMKRHHKKGVDTTEEKA